LGGIALALVQPHDTGVSAVALFLRGSNFGEEDLHGVFLVEPGDGEAAVVNGAAFAEGHHLFRYGTGGFGFGDGGNDAFMFDEAADQVPEHGVAMLAGAAQLGGSFKMSHKCWAAV
jgi:hypothetical protein